MRFKVTLTNEIIKTVKDTYVIELTEKDYNEQIYDSHPLRERDNVEAFVLKATGQTELSVVDLKFKEDKVIIEAEKTHTWRE